VADVDYGVLRRATPEVIVTTLDREGPGEAGTTRAIRCPLCEWQPRPSSRWACADCPIPEAFFGGCGAVWNTFDTGGVCPGCLHAWQWTLCLACGGWSLHDDWYVEDEE
jgi:hypothetical protein